MFSKRYFSSLNSLTKISKFSSNYLNNLNLKKSCHEIFFDRILNNKQIENKNFIINGLTNEKLTFKEFYNLSYKFAYYLKYINGIKKNDCIAIISPNHLHYVTSFYGISITGGIITTVNPLYTQNEIEYQLDITSTKVIIAHPSCLEKVSPIALHRGIPLITLGPTDGNAHGIEEIFSSNSDNVIDPSLFEPVDPNSTLVIPFSSGTTGKSKGVVLSHQNIIANILQGIPYEENALDKNNVVPIVPLPFYHIYGLLVAVFSPLYNHQTVVFLPSFDLQLFLELIPKYRVSRAYLVPPIILALSKHPIVDKYDLSTLKVVNCGAAPLGSDIQQQCSKRLNCIVKQGWGMTELSPVGTAVADHLVTSVEDIAGTSGILLPGTEARIMDVESGEYIDPSLQGEILIRGPQVMQGYYNDPQATKETIRSDGFMHTGDIGYFDHKDRLVITDRKKELIKYKGFQVPPAELEAILISMKEIKDCIVIPVPDDEAGEIPRAYVVLQDNVTVSEQDILDYVYHRVAPHKRLRGGVKFTTSIPKSPAGKLLRRVQIQLDREQNK